MQLRVGRARIQNGTSEALLSRDRFSMSGSNAGFGLSIDDAGFGTRLIDALLSEHIILRVGLTQLSDGIVDQFQQAQIVFLRPLQQEPQPLHLAIAFVSHCVPVSA
jgi:hypothetical protein